MPGARFFLLSHAPTPFLPFSCRSTTTCRVQGLIPGRGRGFFFDARPTPVGPGECALSPRLSCGTGPGQCVIPELRRSGFLGSWALLLLRGARLLFFFYYFL
jgi:hypothetical protein